MSPRSSIDQSPIRRALPRAGLGLSLLAAVALMGGAWGVAYGQTVPPFRPPHSGPPPYGPPHPVPPHGPWHPVPPKSQTPPPPFNLHWSTAHCWW